MWSKISENVPEIGIFEKSTFWKKIKKTKILIEYFEVSSIDHFRVIWGHYATINGI